MSHKFPARKYIIILFWIVIWQTVSMAVANELVLVGPWDVARSLFALVPTADFWKSVGGSFGKISLGFLLAFTLGVLLGSLAFRFSLFREFLEPVILLMKSVPVASFVVLALIWIGSENLSVLVSFLIVFPMFYTHTAAGLESTDPKLLEMAQVFGAGPWRKLRYIYLPTLLPHLVSSCQVALGMSWKSGTAAELIGIPSHTIGEHLYMAKIYLDTSSLFAWTIVIILVSAAFERLFLLLLAMVRKLLL